MLLVASSSGKMSLGEAPESSATVTVPPLSGCPLTAVPEPIFEVVPPHAATVAARATVVTVMASEFLMRTIACSRPHPLSAFVPQTHRTTFRARASWLAARPMTRGPVKRAIQSGRPQTFA